MSRVAEHPVQTRWVDFDGLGHVNHAIVLTYLEEGRDALLERCGIGREQYVVGRCSVEYLGEIDVSLRSLTVECSVTELGRSSITTSERIVASSGDAVVEAAFGLVLWDPERRSSRAISGAERELLRRFEEVSG